MAQVRKIKIEKNVRAPTEQPRCFPIFPWPDMKPGDSFVVNDRVEAASARGSFSRYKRLGKIPEGCICMQRVEANGRIRMWLKKAGA